MAIIIDEDKRVLIQGITGPDGRTWTTQMIESGTTVIAGCASGDGGQRVAGVPVFESVAEAQQGVGPIDVSVVFAPARLVKVAAIEAIEAGVKLVVLVPDGVPVWDAMEIAACAKANDAHFIGPSALGVLSPGRAMLGMMIGEAESDPRWLRRGNVGVMSRSGGMTRSCGYCLGQRGIGLSTLVHVGGDSVVGLRMADVAQMFQDDPETNALVMFGEIGGSQEEELAEMLNDGRVRMPVIAYVAGKAARQGTRFSHAGAITEGGHGSHRGKVEALRHAGATVVDEFGDLPQAAVEVLAANGMPVE